jgi:hypothetical protein
LGPPAAARDQLEIGAWTAKRCVGAHGDDPFDFGAIAPPLNARRDDCGSNLC